MQNTTSNTPTMDASSVSFRPCLRGLLLIGLSAPLLLNGCLPTGQSQVQPYPGHPPVPQAPASPPQEPALTRQVMSPEEQVTYSRQVLEPALATISGRITAYEQRLRDWQDLGSRRETLSLTPDEVEQIVSCRNRVADLQDAYKGLQTRLVDGQQGLMSREQLFNSLQDFKEKDIAYLEGECPQLFNALSSPAAGGRKAAQHEPDAPSAVSTQDSPLPVQEEATPTVPQEPSSNKGSLRIQGLELLKTGHEQEARSTFVTLLTTARQDGDRQLEANSLQMLADLDFGQQEYAAARRKYVELRRLDSSLAARSGRYIAALEAVGTRRDELDAYAALLLGCLTYNPDKDGFTVVQQASEFIRLFPDSPLTEDAADWSRKIEQEAEQWFSGLIAETDRLLAAQKINEALKRIEQVPLDILPLDKQDILRQKKERLQPAATLPAEPVQESAVVLVPESGSQTKAAQSSPVQQAASPLPDPAAVLQETWDKGIKAMETEEYDQAIELFSKLRGTEFSVKAEGKIEEAERLAGESLRKKAAGLFQQALNAADPAAKKELLLSSKSLLEGILRKYPNAGIEAKVKKNLSSVDRELAAASSGSQH